MASSCPGQRTFVKRLENFQAGWAPPQETELQESYPGTQSMETPSSHPRTGKCLDHSSFFHSKHIFSLLCAKQGAVYYVRQMNKIQSLPKVSKNLARKKSFKTITTIQGILSITNEAQTEIIGCSAMGQCTQFLTEEIKRGLREDWAFNLSLKIFRCSLLSSPQPFPGIRPSLSHSFIHLFSIFHHFF